jgi:hypothetical protein
MAGVFGQFNTVAEAHELGFATDASGQVPRGTAKHEELIRRGGESSQSRSARPVDKNALWTLSILKSDTGCAASGQFYSATGQTVQQREFIAIGFQGASGQF